jgi:hypothetical protein
VLHTDGSSVGSLSVEVSWQLWDEEETSALTFPVGFAPAPVEGCWRPVGESECADSRRRATERRMSTCTVEDETGDNQLTTCECEGYNVHVNYGLDFVVGIGEVNLPFEFSYEGGMSFDDKRMSSGKMVQYPVISQTDVVGLDFEGCVGVLNRKTTNSRWRYTDDEGWVQDEEGLSTAAKWFIGIGLFAGTLGTVGLITFPLSPLSLSKSLRVAFPLSLGLVGRLAVLMVLLRSAMGKDFRHQGWHQGQGWSRRGFISSMVGLQ